MIRLLCLLTFLLVGISNNCFAELDVWPVPQHISIIENGNSLSISLTFPFMISWKVLHPTQLQVYIFRHVDFDIIYCFECLMHGFFLSWLIYNLLTRSWIQWSTISSPTLIKQPWIMMVPSLWWGQWLSTLSSSHSSLPLTPSCHFLPFTKNWKWYGLLYRRNYVYK